MPRPVDASTGALHPVAAGQWRYEGRLGGRIDAVLRARFLDPQAREAILGETVEAFRKRVDDRTTAAGMWQGEFWGKYTLAAIAVARYTGDEGLRAAIVGAADDLVATQDADGYLGTYFNSADVINGKRGRNWNIWCRKYTLWGLLETHEFTGDAKYLTAATRFMDHLMTQVGPGKVDIVSTGAFAGLPSCSILGPVVKLYRVTGDDRYLHYAEYIISQWTEGEEGKPDILHKGLSSAPVHGWFPEPEEWAKAYEFLSCVEGLLEMHRLTGRADYLACARQIHKNMVQWDRSAAGDISQQDKLVGCKRLINTLSEICDAVYWERVSFQLLCLTGDPCYADEIERTLYNALLAAPSPDGSWGLRRIRFSHVQAVAPRHCNLGHHQCCVDNLPRGLMQASQTALMTDSAGVALALYNEGKGWAVLPSGRRIGVAVGGDYPGDGSVKIRFSLEKPETFRLRLRIPEWSRETKASGPDGALPAAIPGGWLHIEREWRDGDTVSLQFDMSPRLVRFDPSLLDPADPLVVRSVQDWVAVRQPEDIPGVVPHTLNASMALPHAPAVLVERGPLLLARDQRLDGDADVFAPLPEAAVAMPPVLKSIPPPAGIHLAFEAQFAGVANPVRVCDFASAGNTWDQRTSTFTVWMPLGGNATFTHSPQ